jgi:two-component system, NarL family, invasion response regulator UvrY
MDLIGMAFCYTLLCKTSIPNARDEDTPMSAPARSRVPTPITAPAAAKPAQVRLAIGLQYPLIRAGVRELVAGDPSITIVGETDSSHALLDLVRENDANIALVCVRLPGTGYRELIHRLRDARPGIGVLLMSLRFSAELGLDALRHGAAGYVANECPIAGILAAIRTVGSGGRQVAPEVAELLAAEFTTRGSAPTRRLSPREREVLDGIGEGRSHKQIAAQLNVSAKSIGTYRSRALTKLGLRTTADLVRYSVRREA